MSWTIKNIESKEREKDSVFHKKDVSIAFGKCKNNEFNLKPWELQEIS